MYFWLSRGRELDESARCDGIFDPSVEKVGRRLTNQLNQVTDHR